jgi:hypothetical protein
MSKLSFGQFAAMLLITDAFALICIMGNISAMTVWGFLTGTVVQFLLAIPTGIYYKRGGRLNKIAMWFYLVYIVGFGGMLFVMLCNASGMLAVPAENFSFIPEKLLISGLIAVTCLYVSSPGCRAIARASVIAAALGAVCLAVMVISTALSGNMGYSSASSDREGFVAEVLRGLVLSGGVGSFSVLLGFTKGCPVRYTVGYFALRGLIFTLVILAASAAVGGIMTISEFPVITAAILSQPFSSQRFDAVFLVIFVIAAVFAVAVQVVCASYLLNGIFPEFRRFRSSAVLAFMIASAVFLSGFYVYNGIFAALTAVSPVVAIVARKLILYSHQN